MSGLKPRPAEGEGVVGVARAWLGRGGRTVAEIVDNAAARYWSSKVTEIECTSSGC